MTLNPATLFNQAFDAELQRLIDEGFDPQTFNAAGKRPTKSNPNPAGEDYWWWRRNGPEMVLRWIEWRKKAKWQIWTTPDNRPAIELELEAYVAGTPIRAVVDRIMIIPTSGELCLVDLKSGKRTPESDLQLAVYRYCVTETWPEVDIRYGGYWMARKGDMETVNLERFTPQMIVSWYDRFIKAREAGIFIPHMSSMCKACSLREYCAAYGGVHSYMDPDSPYYIEPEEGADDAGSERDGGITGAAGVQETGPSGSAEGPARGGVEPQRVQGGDG